MAGEAATGSAPWGLEENLHFLPHKIRTEFPQNGPNNEIITYVCELYKSETEKTFC